MTRINFADPKLVERYGSWMRVQVEFYDFLFENAMQMCARHANPILMADAQHEMVKHGWSDTGTVYQAVVAEIEKMFASPEEAWNKFLEQEGGKSG